MQYKKQDEQDWSPSQIATSTSFELDELEAGTNYDARVQGIFGADVSRWVTTSFSTFYCEPEEQVKILYNLVDSYGDGWSGNTIQVMNSDSVVIATLTFDSGYTEGGSLLLCAGETYYFVWVSGNYPGECSFTFTDEFGETLYTGGAPGVSVFFTYTPVIPSCPRPTNLTLDNSTFTTATSSGFVTRSTMTPILS